MNLICIVTDVHFEGGMRVGTKKVIFILKKQLIVNNPNYICQNSLLFSCKCNNQNSKLFLISIIYYFFDLDQCLRLFWMLWSDLIFEKCIWTLFKIYNKSIDLKIIKYKFILIVEEQYFFQ